MPCCQAAASGQDQSPQGTQFALALPDPHGTCRTGGCDELSSQLTGLAEGVGSPIVFFLGIGTHLLCVPLHPAVCVEHHGWGSSGPCLHVTISVCLLLSCTQELSWCLAKPSTPVTPPWTKEPALLPWPLLPIPSSRLVHGSWSTGPGPAGMHPSKPCSPSLEYHHPFKDQPGQRGFALCSLPPLPG